MKIRTRVSRRLWMENSYNSCKITPILQRSLQTPAPINRKRRKRKLNWKQSF